MTLQLITELRSAAAALRRPGGTTTDRISAELLERAAQALAVLQRAPLPATTVTDLLPDMRDDWTPEIYGTWAIRAAERAHGIGTTIPNPPPPSWAEAPDGYNYRAMDSDGRWYWFQDRPYSETIGNCEVWDSEGGYREVRGLNFYPDWADTLEEHPEVGNARG
ncbi:hypothetical protein NR511_10425 [Stenotrophomonas maltophilia]|uniref:hypothetical protein n=1 Tax=Stenotrophomonas maltophilia TaxID=40324 RepID=UPI0021477BA4|nr:hypothetical protein [Stenotrophomonas maltophilia]MCR1535862.1 hypothetical protein [Stenotrophomonas maltophilia]